ncbi:MAG: tRNA1(Val) (adenine(37)-N6)-methyltransferase [Sulfuricurvum sp.]
MLFYQPDGGYSYNSDSIFLYEFATRFKICGKVLDVGAGCGIVGLMIGRDFPQITLEAVEKQTIYADFARRNAHINNIPYTMHEGDFLEHGPHGTYDWIVSNPPFYHEGAARSEDPMLHTARYNVHMPIQEYAKKISKLLKSNGEAAICYDARQFVALCCAFEDAGLRVVDVQFVHSKQDKPSHLVLLRLRKNSRSLQNVWPPFITFDANGAYTPETETAYQKAKAHSIKCPII